MIASARSTRANLRARLAQLGQPYLFYEVIEGGHGAGATLDEQSAMNAREFTYFARKLSLPLGSAGDGRHCGRPQQIAAAARAHHLRALHQPGRAQEGSAGCAGMAMSAGEARPRRKLSHSGAASRGRRSGSRRSSRARGTIPARVGRHWHRRRRARTSDSPPHKAAPRRAWSRPDSTAAAGPGRRPAPLAWPAFRGPGYD